MGKLIEGLWDCKYCDTTRIRGSLRNCPNCGKPRDNTTRFYMPGEITYVPQAQASKINKNPDWICPYCNSLNSDNEQNCISCGSKRTKENLDYFSNQSCKNQQKSSSILDETVKASSSSTEEEFIFPKNSYSRTSGHAYTRRNYFSPISDFNWKFLGIVALVLAMTIGIVYLLIPKTQEITVSQFEWNYSIEIERYKTVQESDWSLPVGGRLLHTNEEFSHTEHVLDHYETKTRQISKQRISGYERYVSGYRDLGNGYFEEITSQRPIYETYYETETYQDPIYVDVPVYRTKYYYEIDKWVYERSVKTSGLDKSPYWGEVILLAKERISSKVEHYYIIGTNSKGEEQKISLSYEDWLSIAIGNTVKLEVSIFGTGKIVE